MKYRNCFWKYAGVTFAVQIVASSTVWISAFALSPRIDPALEAVFYFYWPIMWCGSMLGLQGEVGTFLFGISSGAFIYGILFGAGACMVKNLKNST